MSQEAPKKGGILQAYLNFNVLYKILIGLVIGAIAGIILGIIGISKSRKVLKDFPDNGNAKEGKVTSIIGLILSILSLILVTALFVVMGLTAQRVAENPEILNEMAEEAGIDLESLGLEGVSSSNSSEAVDAAAGMGVYLPGTEEEKAARAAVESVLKDLKDPKSDLRSQMVSEMNSYFDTSGYSFEGMGFSSQEFVDWVCDDLTYTVEEGTVLENQGWVDVEVKGRDLETLGIKFDQLMQEFTSVEGYSSLGQDEITQRTNEIFKQAMDEAEQSDKYVMFDVVHKDSQWSVDESSLWSSLDIILFGYW